jgi:hypothetical protein
VDRFVNERRGNQGRRPVSYKDQVKDAQPARNPEHWVSGLHDYDGSEVPPHSLIATVIQPSDKTEPTRNVFKEDSLIGLRMHRQCEAVECFSLGTRQEQQMSWVSDRDPDEPPRHQGETA